MLTTLIHRSLPRSHLPHSADRAFSTSAGVASQRTVELNRFRKENGPKYAEFTVPTKKLLDSLRALQSERALSNNHDIHLIRSARYRAESNFCRDGFRDIAQLGIGRMEGELKVGEIEEVLTPENGVTWRAVINLATKGIIPELEKLTTEMKSMIKLHRVHGLGDGKAKSHVLERGITTLDELRIYPKISAAQKIGLEHLEDIEQMIPRAEVDVFQGLITKALAGSSLKPDFEITGSYRRGEAVCSDIDMIVWHKSYPTLSDDATASAEIIADVKAALAGADLLPQIKLMADGKKKLMGLTRLPGQTDAIWRRIDIRVCPYDARVYFLLANSGDDTLMRILRSQAKYQGRTLNEFGYGRKAEGKSFIFCSMPQNSSWFVEGTMIPAKDEAEVFKHLGVPYLEPSQRSFKHYKNILPAKFLTL